MKKRIISLILCFIFVLSISSLTYAEELKPQEDSSIITPMVEPCPYWPDGRHHYQTGSTSYIHYKEYIHLHLIYDELGGIIGSYEDWYCDVYKSLDTYCACGKHSPINTHSYTHCHPL